MNTEHLPVLTHTAVLGVDIAVNQRDCERGEYSGLTTRGSAVRCETWPETRRVGGRLRRGLAAWARRNLFDGAQPAGGASA